MSRSCLMVATAAITLGAAAFVPAQIERHHGAHVHGEAIGSFAQDGSALRLELEIPGVNLIGFEHPPRTDQQQRLLDDAVYFLNAGTWLVADTRGGCEMDRLNAHTHGFDADHERDHGHHDDQSHHHGHESDQAHDHDHDQGHHHDHDHGHRHGHDHDHHHDHDHDHDQNHDHDHDQNHDHDHDHAEFHVIAHLNCETPEALRWVELRLFDDYPGNERMAIDVLTDRVATRARLTPANQRIDLTR